MALLSGEVETPRAATITQAAIAGSGWLCYPGKLKPVGQADDLQIADGWFRMALLSGEVETRGRDTGPCEASAEVPDGFAIRGS